MLNEELKEIKKDLSKIKHPKISKILQSEKIDNLINRIQNFYRKITDKLIIKYNLEDELKQGKIFTIIFAIITFIFLIIISVFFAVTLNSIIGIGLLFSFFRQIVFCIKWGYTIIKNKGYTIKKYLINLFPNSKILEEVKERKNIPLYEEEILYQIKDFLDELDNSNIDLDVEKEITIQLKEIVNMLNLNSLEFKDEFQSLDYKKNIAIKLSDIYKLYQDNIYKRKRQEEFLILKNDVSEQINQLENKIYVKKR